MVAEILIGYRVCYISKQKLYDSAELMSYKTKTRLALRTTSSGVSYKSKTGLANNTKREVVKWDCQG